MSIFHRHPKHSEVSDATPAEFDAQTDLALPHTGHEEEIDAGVGMLGSSLVPADDHAGYDAERDIGFAP